MSAVMRMVARDIRIITDMHVASYVRHCAAFRVWGVGKRDQLPVIAVEAFRDECIRIKSIAGGLL